jgi:hypothetical protein
VSDAVQVCAHEIERSAKAAERHDDLDAMREITGKRLCCCVPCKGIRFLMRLAL